MPPRPSRPPRQPSDEGRRESRAGKRKTPCGLRQGVCGRIVYVYDAATGRLIAKFADAPVDDKTRHVMEKQRYNVPPASHLPFLVNHHDGHVSLEVARWGFPIPQRPNGVFNTRIETAAASPMWKGMLGKTHGVLVAKGFYEWDRTKAQKVPYFVHRADGEPMLLGAVVGKREVEGGWKLCASIVTCPPNALVGAWHDRMPVVLEERTAATWLHPSGLDDAVRLAVPAPEGVLAAHEVGPGVNSTDNDAPELMRPVPSRPRQATL